MEPLAWLVIERGEPYEAGMRIPLNQAECMIGRCSDGVLPDISFSNFLVSRRHCLIRLDEEEMILKDLGSKHGTALNGQVVGPQEERVLKNGDRITLAMGVAAFRFVQSGAEEMTLDLSQTMALKLHGGHSPIVLDQDKHEAYVDGKPILLTNKEWDFLSLLEQHPNKLMSYDQIRTTVWPERSIERDQVPDVGIDEINVLIYRLRRKMGERGKTIKTVRGCGCILEI